MGVGHGCLSLFVEVIYLIFFFFCFRFHALTGLGAFLRADFLCISVLRTASGPGMGLAGCEGALNPPVVCSAGCSLAMFRVLVLLLLLCDLFSEAICFMSCLVLFCSCVFQPF